MSALYPSWSNTLYRLVLLAIVLLVVAVIVGPWLYVRTPYNTNQFLARDQPVEFDHRHHARDDGIECLYCHSAAERSASAGVPPTELCMGCHAQIWNESPLLEPVRRSYFSGVPIPWKRIHDLADFVYFNHSVHVNYGIQCERCHGDVGKMAQVYQVAPLTMGWCLDCHRQPERAIGKPLDITSTWDATWEMYEESLLVDREITRLTTCTACHR